MLRKKQGSLNAEEREIANSRAIRQIGASDRIGGLDVRQLVHSLLVSKMWANAVCVPTLPVH